MSIRKKLKSLTLILMCACLMGTANATIFAKSENAQNAVDTKGYDYPTKPGSSEWRKFDNHLKMIEACQIPENALKSMSTNALIETVLNYPLLGDMYGYDSIQEGFILVSGHFNGLTELLQREDSASKLVTKYKNMEIAQDVKTITSKQYYDLSNIEVILMQDEILNKLNSTEKAELDKEIEKKYSEKKAHPDIYGRATTIPYRIQAEKQALTSNTTVSMQSTDSINNVEYVWTPNYSQVAVFADPEALTPEEIAFEDQWVHDNYPTATLLDSATSVYNCHSYAWYWQSTDNPYVMSNPYQYMWDGSYVDRNGSIYDYVAGDKIYYSQLDYIHSGVVVGLSRIHTPYVISKWGNRGLVYHYYTYCEYYYGDAYVQDWYQVVF